MCPALGGPCPGGPLRWWVPPACDMPGARWSLPGRTAPAPNASPGSARRAPMETRAEGLRHPPAWRAAWRAQGLAPRGSMCQMPPRLTAGISPRPGSGQAFVRLTDGRSAPRASRRASTDDGQDMEQPRGRLAARPSPGATILRATGSHGWRSRDVRDTQGSWIRRTPARRGSAGHRRELLAPAQSSPRPTTWRPRTRYRSRAWSGEPRDERGSSMQLLGHQLPLWPVCGEL
jgi:hypothetical protein